MNILGYIVYGLIALVVILTALGMLISRNSVYSALALVLNFASVALLYIILGAPFISLVQISVYAGAIMVLFLFVIMMLGAEKLPEKPAFRGQRFMAFSLAFIFLVEAALTIVWKGSGTAGGVGMPMLSPEFASPANIGRMLFSQYALPFLITGILLLAAVVGAIALPYGEKLVRRELRTKKED